MNSLKAVIQNKASDLNLSLRSIAKGIKISPSYLSDILNDKCSVDPRILNTLADFLGLTRIELYEAAGLLDLEQDEELIARFRELAEKDDELRRLFSALMELEDEERKRRIQLILAAMGK